MTNQVYSITTNILLMNSKMLKNMRKKSLTARYDNILLPFYERLKKFEKFTPRTMKTKTEKDIVDKC